MEGQLSGWYMDSEAPDPMFGELNLYATLTLLSVGSYLSDSLLRPPCPLPTGIVIEKVTYLSLFLYLREGKR